MTKPRIAFFVAAPDSMSGSDSMSAPANDNHQRLPNAFAAANWSVTCFDREALALRDNKLVGKTLQGEVSSLTHYDLYFALGFGAEATFLDRMQLLRGLDQRRFVNTVDALVYQHGKTSLILDHPDVPQPKSYLSNDPDELAAVVAGGGAWIVKPPAASFGRDVFSLGRGDTNVRSILEHLCRDGHYALLQEDLQQSARLAACEQLEKRVLIVAGRLIGTYAKKTADHRGNLDAGATPVAATLTAGECQAVELLAGKLDGMGVRFATADLLAGRVLEINVANPGWLKTYQALAGEDLAPATTLALQEWWRAALA